MIYLSGAITAETEELWDLNLQLGRQVAIEMAAAGIPYHSPHLNAWDFHKEVDLDHVTWQDYMDMDYEIIGRCDGVLMMEGWEESKGAVLERQFAIDNGIRVFHSIKDLLKEWPFPNRYLYKSIYKANVEVMRLLSLLERVMNAIYKMDECSAREVKRSKRWIMNLIESKAR